MEEDGQLQPVTAGARGCGDMGNCGLHSREFPMFLVWRQKSETFLGIYRLT